VVARLGVEDAPVPQVRACPSRPVDRRVIFGLDDVDAAARALGFGVAAGPFLKARVDMVDQHNAEDGHR
jgi:hypothetical protein